MLADIPPGTFESLIFGLFLWVAAFFVFITGFFMKRPIVWFLVAVLLVGLGYLLLTWRPGF